jgi:hypothetical protein
MDVWQCTFKDTTIHSAFWKSGVWPINHELFQDADFAPSINTSTMTRDVPDSYPVCTEEWPDHQSWSDDNESSSSNDNDEEDPGDVGISDANTRQAQQHTNLAAIELETSPLSNLHIPSLIPPAQFYLKVPKPLQQGHDTEGYISALEHEVTILCQENAEVATHAVMILAPQIFFFNHHPCLHQHQFPLHQHQHQFPLHQHLHQPPHQLYDHHHLYK